MEYDGLVTVSSLSGMKLATVFEAAINLDLTPPFVFLAERKRASGIIKLCSV